MKSIKTLITCILTGSVLLATGQIPKLMVIPDDIYLNKNGYMMTIDNEGSQVTFPDYDRALLEDTDLYTSIVKIQEMFAERGFELEDLKSTMDAIKEDQAYTNIASNKLSGAGVVQSPLDLLNNKANPDIILSLAFFIEKVGPRRQVNFNIRAIDAYSMKAAASINGIGQPSSQAQISELVAEAVINEIPRFQDQIQAYFNKMKEQGREMTFRFLLYDDAMMDFEDDCGNTGEVYIDLLDNWFIDNSVNDNWDIEDDSETRLIYSAMMPMFDENGRKIRVRNFSRGIRKILENQCMLEDQVKIDGKGQGEVWFFIGPTKM